MKTTEYASGWVANLVHSTALDPTKSHTITMTVPYLLAQQAELTLGATNITTDGDINIPFLSADDVMLLTIASDGTSLKTLTLVINDINVGTQAITGTTGPSHFTIDMVGRPVITIPVVKHGDDVDYAGTYAPTPHNWVDANALGGLGGSGGDCSGNNLHGIYSTTANGGNVPYYNNYGD